jgi:hypothetical protein
MRGPLRLGPRMRTPWGQALVSSHRQVVGGGSHSVEGVGATAFTLWVARLVTQPEDNKPVACRELNGTDFSGGSTLSSSG